MPWTLLFHRPLSELGPRVLRRATAGSGLMSSGLTAGTQRTRGMTVASTLPSFACTLLASQACHLGVKAL